MRKSSAGGNEVRIGGNFIPYTPRARAFPSAVQSVPAATATAITLDLETFDTDNMHDLVTNNSRITINTPGVYIVKGKISWAAPGAASVAIYTQLRKNGSIVALEGAEIGNLGNQGVGAMGIFECVKGDYFEIWGDQRSAGALNTGPTDALTGLEAVYIGSPMNAVREKPVVSYVTPAQFAALTPADGDEVYLVADSSTGTIWHFRYNAGSSSAYKWEFLGGPALYSNITPQEQIGTSGSLVDLTTVGPSITLPRGGNYYLSWGASSEGTVSRDVTIAPTKGGTRVAGIDLLIYSRITSEMLLPGSMESPTNVTLSASDVVKLQYQSNATGANESFLNRWLSIRPIRIS